MYISLPFDGWELVMVAGRRRAFIWTPVAWDENEYSSYHICLLSLQIL